MRATALLVVLTVASLSLPPHAASAYTRSTLAHPWPLATASLLARDFAAPDLSYLLLDLRNNTLAANRWPDSRAAIPVGSLVKPFLAITYAESHGYRFPYHDCKRGTCWLPRGHGRLGIVQAVALSCNSYFTALGASLEPRQVREAAKQFALVGPPANASAGALAGRYGLWRETPEALVHAYAELLARRDQPGIADIVAGMRESAKRGTGSGISASVPDLAIAAKTGTAPCTHLPHAPGDGFALAAWPADSPRYILLVRQHGRPGALAAVIAGKMIRELEQQP